MRYTFYSDECMVITIPLGSLRDASEGQLMPEKFHCVFKDVYKVFLKGQPKALGASQLIAGVLIVCLGFLVVPDQTGNSPLSYTMPSFLFMAAGMLSYAAGHSPNICVTKVSFSLNMISSFWAVAAISLCILHLLQLKSEPRVFHGILGIIAVLLLTELIVAMVMIYWESKAVCRQHFNVLPMVTLKQDV
ncbi:membrane-spanning 4-domains subfamily A member 4D-like [Esox lucius]|uniref:Membrane-spanning 4-domains subfamily A member 4D n=1 Tax=Esox lucius TaxID=8010 RepID=C1BXG5_ESOLU|nr:membrane-spanning 4-domains subfamily A member 4D-like [Esox lucius]ACO13718.1 Membrane-spanning 4-domains subfamily A member 4D [Esox lucius]